MKTRNVFLLLAFTAAIAGQSYDFTTKNSDGARLYYNITSSALGNRTVEVTFESTFYGTDERFEQKIRIPSKVTYNGRTYTVTGIGDGAFEMQTQMPSVILPSTITYIGERAFKECWVLDSLNIPASVTSIGSGAFCSCTSLKELTFNAVHAEISEKAFRWCQSLEEPLCTDSLFIYLSLPASEKYPSFHIAEGTKAIASGAFVDAAYLESLTIPASVENVYDMELFYYDTGDRLKSIYIAATTPPTATASYVKSLIAENVTLYVSDADPAIIEAYKSSKFWGQFKNIEATTMPGNPTNKFDVNSDGNVNSADIVAIYNHILDSENSGIPKDSADTTSDGEVNSADIVAVYNCIQNGATE